MAIKGLSIIVRSEEQLNTLRNLLSPEILYITWHSSFLLRGTAVVIWAKKKTNYEIGSVGDSVHQANTGIKIVEFSDFFKITD